MTSRKTRRVTRMSKVKPISFELGYREPSDKMYTLLGVLWDSKIQDARKLVHRDCLEPEKIWSDPIHKIFSLDDFVKNGPDIVKAKLNYGVINDQDELFIELRASYSFLRQNIKYKNEALFKCSYRKKDSFNKIFKNIFGLSVPKYLTKAISKNNL